MNYIRGAVNAISAPYQYYKDLPPINPSTLTGAIDVIVIRRPAEDGQSELVCSPFHVRFGKWQVLRPGEKKVNVFVNGNPIPFNMKIGEAGEAFFVFETDDDVPEDLITSPIIQPTIIDAATDKKKTKDPVDTDRFGAKQEDEGKVSDSTISLPHRDGNTRVEPDFLDLDGGKQEVDTSDDTRTTPKQAFHVPQALRKSGSKATIIQQSLPSPPPSRRHSKERTCTPEITEQDHRVDETLKALRASAHVPEVEYHHDVTLDMEGYKSGYHDRERSDRTVKSATSSSHDPNKEFKYPPESSSHTSRIPSKPQLIFPHSQSATHSPYAASPSPTESSSQNSSPIVSVAHPHPFRATSEPPPDIDDDTDTIPPLSVSTHRFMNPESSTDLQELTQEYSWEWGAFPQPSPMKASFGKGGRPELPRKSVHGSRISSSEKGKGFINRKGRPLDLPASTYGSAQEAEEFLASGENDHSQHGHSGRSRSIPPDFLNPTREKRRETREYKEYEDLEGVEEEDRGRVGHPLSKERPHDLLKEADNIFGSGGTLSPSRDDQTTFILAIERRKIGFQLSLVPDDNTRGRTYAKNHNEFDAGLLFDRYRVDWNRFLEDESIVNDPRLVIRWGADQYITRNDGSPLIDALIEWRSTALNRQASGEEVRPVSPVTLSGMPANEDVNWEPAEQKTHGRSKSEPPSDAEKRQIEAEDKKKDETTPLNQAAGVAKKPTSSSWVQWWSRSRRTDAVKPEAQSQPVLDSKKDGSSASLPLQSSSKGPDKNVPLIEANVLATPMQKNAILPRNTFNSGDQETTPTRPEKPPARIKKYAKTLRLTSDQLSSLNLKSGANAITFSLSASGAVAATARIFVWDSTDLVVISDIDGTITKSDGLGHVFAMIGRDWTHVGVAKLYTDIVRNGYKIMYLTSRAIGQADATRDYLKGIKQNNYQLPEGPVIMSPDRLMASLHREVIMRKPEVFKMACLRDIQRLFGESARNPFYAGFGNRITDALSYRSVNVPSARIFTIDSSGEVKMELLELAGYKSSYIHMTDLVDQMFPPINRKWAPEYTDFNYWKTPVQEFPLPDLSPPSPALSARSDTSNQSTLARLRNFSLVGNANYTPKQTPNQQASSDEGNGDLYRSSHLRQMSSFEKLSSTLGFIGDAYRRSASPESFYLDSDDEDDDGIGSDRQKRKKTRRKSMTSMPGTLDERHFGLDDDEEEEPHFTGSHPNSYSGQDDGQDEAYDGEEEERDDPEEEAEEAFDDDLLAAGEMQKVPFL